jgi:hypothetical protein
MASRSASFSEKLETARVPSVYDFQLVSLVWTLSISYRATTSYPRCLLSQLYYDLFSSLNHHRTVALDIVSMRPRTLVAKVFNVLEDRFRSTKSSAVLALPGQAECLTLSYGGLAS